MNRLLATVVLALVMPSAASAATVTLDPRGVTVVNGTPLFIVGVSGPPAPEGLSPRGVNGLDELAASGVRMHRFLDTGGWDEETLPNAIAALDAAAARGSFVWLGLRELIEAQPGTPEDAKLRHVIQTLAPHPGMGIWRGADEPWWSGTSVEELAYGYSVVKELDPDRPLFTIQAARGTAEDLAPYSAVTDMHGADPFPVGIRFANPDLHAVGRWTKTMLSITPSKGVVITLGACHSGSDDDKGNYLQPSYTQTRYMIYDAIINGARGLTFYGTHLPRCMTARDKTLGWNWTYWDNVLGRIIREIAPHMPIHAALVSPGTGVGLRINSSMAQVISRRVGSDLWVFVANRQGKRNIRISNFPKATGRQGKVYMAPRRINLTNGGFTDSFQPWAVRMYRFPIIP